MSRGEYCLALDIGTRKVAGLVVEQEGEVYRVRAVEVIEHRSRAMFDGQVHDIPAVAEVVSQVKQSLEKRLKCQLTEAAVAAAGRALRTVRAGTSLEIGLAATVSREDVLALEVEAVQEALRSLSSQEKNWADYHCVGYSVLRYLLDDSPIANLVGQRGKTIQVEVVATFLPRVVVDSLYTVVEEAGLRVASLTLEPIAASAVVIPPGMRQLNLALIDIGAGTSDIAVSNQGMIVGYGMVPVAGDEISEKLSQEFLLDFATAERVKRSLAGGGRVEFVDAVGVRRQVEAETVVAAVAGVVDGLAREVAEKIIEINGRPPQAVICVGGGSLTPGITAALARHLDLPENRVVVRGLEVMQNLKGNLKKLEGPKAVTPVGIAITARSQQALDLATVTVNGRPVRLLQSRQARVADALLAAGLSVKDLYGRPGPGFSVEINGELTFVKGTPGQPARITVKGEPATLETTINFGDDIAVTPAVPGQEPVCTLKELIPALTPKRITFEGRSVYLEPKVFVNGEAATPEDKVSDNARITYNPLETVRDVLAYLDRQVVAGEVVMVNGAVAQPETPVLDGDVLEIVRPASAPPVGFTVTVNGEKVFLTAENKTAIFADIFKVLDFASQPPAGKRNLVMEINGEKAAFTSTIAPGDEITLRWE